ncbi:hypothetical protein JCM8547_001596 [Rhodosporidiobolus lusitaniae]
MSVAATGAYVPPFATTTAAPTTTTAARATFASVYSASYTGTVTTSAQIVDATGGVDSSSLLEYFTRPYLDAHTLSLPTWRYAYILWFVLVGTLLLWSILYHLSGSGTGGSAVGAWFRKISIRRLTWTRSVGGGGLGLDTSGVEPEGEKAAAAQRTRKKVVWASPTLAQTVTVLVLVGAAVCLSFVGDDYIAPTTCTFGGECGYQAYYGTGPPKTTYRAKRALPGLNFPSFSSSSSFLSDDSDSPAPPTPAGIFKRGVNNPNGWAPFNDPLLASSNANIAFNAWSAAARLGLISYAMLPLAVMLALKQWPFNVFATPWLTNYHFDKTAILHRWSGRVIWAFSTGHAIGWFWQAAHDKDPFGRMVLIPLFAWWRFVAGVVAWVLLTILTAFSFKPIRTRFYELFYWSHVFLVIVFLVACILHHAPLLWWPLIALVWWGAERAVRFVTFLWINGIFEGIWFREPSRSARSSFTYAGVQEKDGSGEGKYPPLPYDESSEPLQAPVMGSRQGSYSTAYPPSSSQLPFSSSRAPSYASSPSAFQPPSSSSARLLPPPGFASAQLLPGRTIRLTLHVPHTLRWAPGQHLLLYMPQIRPFDSHPYTIASVDERSKGIAPVGGADKSKKGSEVVLLVRAQKGFSKALWDYVAKKRQYAVDHQGSGGGAGAGVNLRAMVSWPMGSAGRVRWGAYESLTIVCGGTGISFGLSVLENACRRMVRKEEDPKWRTTRVRFVWIMREFAHLSWVASTLRRCIEMCDSSQLQVDLFVTHDAPKRPSRRQQQQQHYNPYDASAVDDLAPPAAPFASGARFASPGGRDSLISEMSDYSDGEGASPTGSRFQLDRHDGGESGGSGEHDSITDFVLFEGEEDHRTAGEAEVSAKLKKEGKLRRALSRRGQGSLRRPNNASSPAPPQQNSPAPHFPSADSTASFEALPLDNEHEHDYAPRSASFGDLGAAGRHPSSSFDYGYVQPSSSPLAQHAFDDARSEAGTLVGGSGSSTRHLIKPSGSSTFGLDKHCRESSYGSYAPPSTGPTGKGEQPDEAFFLDVTAAEQEDLDAVAELAKTGYPRLKEIINDEVDRLTGKTVVACCGPTSLNTVVRNLVARKIDLKKVAKGDPRGQLSLVVEDFSF